MDRGRARRGDGAMDVFDEDKNLLMVNKNT